MCRASLFAAFAFLGAVVPCVATDETVASSPPAPSPWERGSIRLGGYIANFDSTVSIGVNNVGVNVNLD